MTALPAENAVFLADSPAALAAARHYPFMVRKALAFAAKLEKGRLDILMPDGRVFRTGGREPGPEAVMRVRDLAFAKLLAQGDVGIAEAYLRGHWDSPNLTRFLEIFCVNQPVIAQLLEGRPIVRILQMVRHWMNRNTRQGARRNIHAHYDLGNRFYSAWLDQTMTYSSALFDKGGDLTSAQIAKYRALAQSVEVGAGDRVLEIGCGWGGFAEFLGKEVGARVLGLTISQEQFEFAKRRIFEAGLNDKVEIALRDYRDETGVYDRVVSIEMIEAVGEAYWPVYFRQIRDRLRPGGAAGLQAITIQEKLFEGYRKELDFIRGYVFPGGMLPTATILRELGRGHGMRLAAERVFGQDYALTLSEWRDRFLAAWPNLKGDGFDDRFGRLWEYYLSYCEAGFRAGAIDVRQMVFARA